MDHKQDFKALLDRFLAGSCTPEEEALLERFFEQSGTQEKPVSLSEQDRRRMFAALRESPRFSAQPVKMNTWLAVLNYRVKRVVVWQAAAVLLLLLGFWQWQNGNLFSGALAYKQISCPQGNLLKVTLPDSSVVILNANSTLSYAADFNKHRELKLTGEAHFNVIRDDKYPFIIHTSGAIDTKVLGTSFTIRSYDDLPETRIMVISGRVQVLHADTVLGTLGSNGQVTYNRLQEQSHQDIVADAGKQAGWTRGKWEYESMPLKELQSLLLNYYNIHITTRGAVTQQLVANANMNFTNRQSAEDIVNIFCITANCHYKWLNHATVEIY